MIHTPNFTTAMRNVAILGAGALLSACAGNQADYPSFAIPTASEDTGEKENRVSMRFPGVLAPTIRDALPASDPLPAELDARLAAINARGLAAAKAFSDNVEATWALASAATASAPESDSWTAAQVRLATLTSHHSTTHLALADLDTLAATAQIAKSAPNERAMIARLQTSFALKLDEQSRQLAEITAQLD